jgi:hypothetical protein
MTVQQVEDSVTELVHREPFAPFLVELMDGRTIDLAHPRLAFDSNGAVFFGPDGGLVDFEFKNVRAIRLLNTEAVA